MFSVMQKLDFLNSIYMKIVLQKVNIEQIETELGETCRTAGTVRTAG
jgi:hypothetical protein